MNGVELAPLEWLFTCLALAFVWTLRSRNNRSILSVNGKIKIPPIAPYWVPFFGHLISWLRDAHSLATRTL